MAVLKKVSFLTLLLCFTLSIVPSQVRGDDDPPPPEQPAPTQPHSGKRWWIAGAVVCATAFLLGHACFRPQGQQEGGGVEEVKPPPRNPVDKDRPIRFERAMP